MISVCIITRDEEEKLNRCLNSLKKYPVEVVVVDTGSKDGTLNMLNKWHEDNTKKFELVIGNFKWCDDFSKARNHAASLAKNDIILVVDSDDVVEELNLKKIENVFAITPSLIGQAMVKDKLLVNGEINFSPTPHARMYNRRFIEWTNSIHEQLNTKKDSKIKAFYKRIDVVLEHDGYMLSPEKMRKKNIRNIKLLEKELENGTENEMYIHYQLGKSYYSLGEFNKAADNLAKALDFDLNPNDWYVADMVIVYGHALIDSGQADIALGLESVKNEFGHIADFSLMMGDVYLKNNMYGKALGEFLGATQCSVSLDDGSNSYIAFYKAAQLNQLLGNIDGALMLYKQCGDYAPAKQRIAEIEAAQK